MTSGLVGEASIRLLLRRAGLSGRTSNSCKRGTERPDELFCCSGGREGLLGLPLTAGGATRFAAYCLRETLCPLGAGEGEARTAGGESRPEA